MDQRGIPTIGYGHTGHEVIPGLVWTQEQADDSLLLDTKIAVTCVNHCIRAPLNQSEFDALTSLCYNIGTGNFHSSTLVSRINSGVGYIGERAAFLEWDHTNSRVNSGLERRRDAEWKLFVTGVFP